MKTLYQFVIAIAAVLLPIQHVTAQSTRSVIVNTNALLTTGFLPYAVSSTRVAPGPIARVDASTVAVSNQVLSATLTRGTTALSGPAATIDWDTSDRYTWTIAAASTCTHANVPTGGGTVQYVSLTVTSPGGLTIDFVFPGGVTTNWVSNFVRIPRAGQTEFGFSPRGSIMDIWAIPDAYATADGEVYRRASGTNGFGVVTGTGDVVGPASATDNAIARFDGVTGKLIQSSAVSVADNGAFTFPTGVRQEFRPDASLPGFSVGTVSGDPTFYVDGDLWYDTLAERLRAGINGTAVTLGAGGGSALWASTSSLLIPSPAVNVVAIESQSSDAATNQVLILDSGAEWTVNGPKAISIRNNGVEQAYQQINGAIAIGESTDSFWVPDGSDIIAGVRDAAIGDASVFNVYFAAVDDASAASIWGDTLISGSSVSGNASLFMTSNNGVNDSAFTIFGTPTGFSLTATANAATNFFVGSTSGYTGAGTKFLSDDGTYKSPSVPAGASIWTNVSDEVRLIGNLNAVTISTNTGGIMLGNNAEAGWGPLGSDDGLIILHDPVAGDDNTVNVLVTSVHDVNSYSFYGELRATVQTNNMELNLSINDAGGESGTKFNFSGGTAQMLTKVNGNIVTSFNPGIAAGSPAYLFDTGSVLTNGDSILLAANTGVTHFRVAGNSGYGGGGTKFLSDDGTYKQSDARILACSDLTTAITVSTNKAYFYAPYALTVTRVKATLNIAQASGSTFTVDINEEGTSILSTKLTVDNTENTSDTAAAAPVISDASIANNARVSIDVDQVGNGTASGLIVEVYFNRQ